MKNSLFKEGTLYLLGEALSKGLPFFMLPYLTRKLGADGFGELSYYLMWLALLNVFISLSQDGAIARYFYFYGQRSISMIVKTGYIYSTFLSIIILAIAILYQNTIATYIVLTSLFQVFVNVQLSLAQCSRQPLKYITIQLSLSTLNVLLTLLLLQFFSTKSNLVENRIFALLLANILAFIIASILMRKLLRKNKITVRRMKISILYIFSFGIPLIFHHLSFFVKGQIDRLFIYEQYHTDTLGIYSAGIQLASILPILIMALNKAVVPHFYQKMKTDYDAITQKIVSYSLKSILICFIPALLAFILPNALYVWFLGENYVNSKYFTVFYLIGFGLNIPYLILVNFLFFKAKNKIIASASIISTIIYLILLVIFSKISIQLIPLSLLISNVILIIYLILCVKKELK